MKILCIADTIDPLIYNTKIKERFSDIDLVLSAGDLPLEYYGFIVSCLNKALYFVFGNHFLKRFNYFRNKEYGPKVWIDNIMYKNNFGATYLGTKCKYIKKYNLIIAGLGGCRKYNNGPNQYTEMSMTLQILRLLPKLLFNKIFHGRYLDILLTHAAPLGINDMEDPCHKGFKVFLYFLKLFRPQYLLHGHIHLFSLNAKRQSQYLDTRVINVYKHYILDLGEWK